MCNSLRRSLTRSALLGWLVCLSTACSSTPPAGPPPIIHSAPDNLLSDGTDAIYPIADAALRGGTYADDASGTNNELKAKTTADDSYTRVSAIEFRLSDIDASVPQQLWVYGRSDSDDVTIDAVAIGDEDTWDESTATWNNMWLPNVDRLSQAASSGINVPSETFTSDIGWHAFDIGAQIVALQGAGYQSATVFLKAHQGGSGVVTIASHETGTDGDAPNGNPGSPYLLLGPPPGSTPDPGAGGEPPPSDPGDPAPSDPGDPAPSGDPGGGAGCDINTVLPPPKDLNICRALVEDLVLPPVVTLQPQCNVNGIECVFLPHCCVPGACLGFPECVTTKQVVEAAKVIAHAGETYCGVQEITPEHFVTDVVNDRFPDQTTLSTGGANSLLYTVAGSYIDYLECSAQPLSGNVRDTVGRVMGLSSFPNLFTQADVDRARILPHRDSGVLGLPKDGYDAITLDSLVILQDNLYDALASGDVSYDRVARGEATPDESRAFYVIVHELVHVRQYRELGRETFANQYLRDALVNGYADVSFEQEAYSVSGHDDSWLENTPL